MHKTSITLIIIAMIGTANAEERTTFRDNNGRVTGWATTNSVGTQFYNSNGQNTGRAATNNTGTTLYNNMGRVTGSARRK
jgi:hypothetical protein